MDCLKCCSTRSDSLVGTKIDYQFLGLSRMRNQNISSEILGDLNLGSNDISSVSESETTEKSSITSTSNTGSSDLSDRSLNKLTSKVRPYVVATLDGTIMLVEDEVIKW